MLHMLLPMVFNSLQAVTEENHKSVVVVASPLISLMEDQVASYSAEGIKAAFIDCDSDVSTKSSVGEGAFQVVFFSIEALISNYRWRNTFQEEPYFSRLVALVIDEAHCVKQWYINK